MAHPAGVAVTYCGCELVGDEALHAVILALLLWGLDLARVRVGRVLPARPIRRLLNTRQQSDYYRGRNNSKIPGSQQDYLVGKSSSPQTYLVVWKWPRFKATWFVRGF